MIILHVAIWAKPEDLPTSHPSKIKICLLFSFDKNIIYSPF